MIRRILGYVAMGLVLMALSSDSAMSQAPPSGSAFKGEYHVTRDANPICVPFARNLNQFRRLDFDACHPRLAKKYSEFTKPRWEEIPFDPGLAEQVIKAQSANPRDAETSWQAWLVASEPLRAEEKVKLWRTRIDVNGDGAPETILRLDNPLTIKAGQADKSWVVNEGVCPYRDATLYMLESSNEFMKREFNRAASNVADIVHFAKDDVSPGESNRYYGIARLSVPAPPDGEHIGATRGVLVYRLSRWGVGEVCSINWVPTGRYRAPERSLPPR